MWFEMKPSIDRYNEQGVSTVQLYDEHPSLSMFYTEYEKGPDLKKGGWIETFVAINDQPWILAVAISVYVLLLVGGTAFMKDRKPFDLRVPLILWNLLLAVFSFCGAVRTVPHLLNTIYVRGWDYSMCANAFESYGYGAVGAWTGLFILSKIPEFVDTFFIIFRKKTLIFLHWYHHITVAMFCWHSYYCRSSAGLYFVAMNYSVHAVMYFYYFLSACRIRVRWGLFVTLAQISQMFVGVAVCGYVFYKRAQGFECQQPDENLISGAVMYASYFVLFFLFFLQRYCSSPSDEKTKTKSKKAAKKLD